MTQQRWIFLAATPDADPLLTAVKEGAARAGLVLVADDARSSGPEAGHIVLTNDQDRFLKAPAADKVAITPLYRPTCSSAGAQIAASYSSNLRASSAALSQYSKLPDDIRILSEQDAAKGEIRLFDDLSISAPLMAANTEPRLIDLASALSIHEKGRPAIGDKSHWTPLVFNYDERAIEGQSVPGRLDLTGRPRTLVYGPYIVMPRGLWRATFRFSVDRAASTRRFRFDWGGQTEHAEHLLSPGAPGFYELQMEYFWSEPAPAEARILVMEGVFEGAMDFLGVDIELIGRDPPPSE